MRAIPLLLLTGCGQFIRGYEPPEWEGIVVGSPEDIEDAQILDARTADEYAAGHIPGAARIHWTEVTGFDDDDLWDTLDAGDLAAVLGDSGIDSDRPVVVYGSGPEGYGTEGDLYWTLRYLGHEDVYVLGGGWLGWLAQDGATTTDDDGPDSTVFSYAVNASVHADSDDVLDWDGVILDVRSREEWDAGHIPGAVWLEWTAVFDDAGALLATDEVEDVFGEVGITANSKVVTYCAGGIRAGHTFMMLETIGVTEAANYVGSWSRWSDEGRPVEE